MSTQAKRLAVIMPLIRLAGDAAPCLAARERAALFEAVATITKGIDAHLHGHSAAAAKALRDAEGHQLTFAALLRQSTPQS